MPKTSAPPAGAPSRCLLSTSDASAYIGIAVQTMARWRCEGSGPAFIKLSHRHGAYDQADLDAWVDARRRNSTSAEAA